MEIEAQGERVAVSEKRPSGSALKVLALIMRHGWSCREHIANPLTYLMTELGEQGRVDSLYRPSDAAFRRLEVKEEVIVLHSEFVPAQWHRCEGHFMDSQVKHLQTGRDLFPAYSSTWDGPELHLRFGEAVRATHLIGLIGVYQRWISLPHVLQFIAL